MSQHSNEEIERGLLAVAVANGNTRRAQQALAVEGLDLPRSTLHRWQMETHAERYIQIQADVLPKIRAQAAEQHMELAERGMAVEQKLLDKLEEEVNEIPSRDLAGAARNVATGTAIHTDKAGILRGEPSVIVSRGMHEIVRSLKAKGIVIEVEAEEVEIEENPPIAELASRE